MKHEKPTSKDRVRHVIEAIDAIQAFVSGHSEKSLMQDMKTISACLYQFSIIGEASFHIESEVLKKYTYPWHKVKAFRNFILHEYFGIEMNLIWHTSKSVLPDLKKLMQEILETEYGES